MGHSRESRCGVCGEGLWIGWGGSHEGIGHSRKNRPNQDACLIRPCENGMVALVSDGHGSPLYFRSDRGARFAVEAASEVLAALARSLRVGGVPEALPRELTQELSGNIHRKWKEAVHIDLQADPFSDAEIPAVIRSNSRDLERLRAEPHVAYGANLGAALVSADYMIRLRLGDVDFLLLYQDGEVYPKGMRHEPGEESESLCQDSAITTMAWKLDRKLPRLLLITTDGVRKSFPEIEGYQKVIRDIYGRIETERGDDLWAHINDNVGSQIMSDLLRESATYASGDDSTLVLLYRFEPTGEAPILPREDGVAYSTDVPVLLSAVTDGSPPAEATVGRPEMGAAVRSQTQAEFSPAASAPACSGLADPQSTRRVHTAWVVGACMFLVVGASALFAELLRRQARDIRALQEQVSRMQSRGPKGANQLPTRAATESAQQFNEVRVSELASSKSAYDLPVQGINSSATRQPSTSGGPPPSAASPAIIVSSKPSGEYYLIGQDKEWKVSAADSPEPIRLQPEFPLKVERIGDEQSRVYRVWGVVKQAKTRVLSVSGLLKEVDKGKEVALCKFIPHASVRIPTPDEIERLAEPATEQAAGALILRSQPDGYVWAFVDLEITEASDSLKPWK